MMRGVRPLISFITPWLDRPQFIEDYERATAEPGAEVIFDDNQSGPHNAAALRSMIWSVGRDLDERLYLSMTNLPNSENKEC